MGAWAQRSLFWMTVACVAVCSAAGGALAREITVAWDPNPPQENVTGYVLCFDTVSQADPSFSGYANEVDVGSVTEAPLVLPDDGATYYIAVVAYNASGLRSDYSQEVATGSATAYTVSATGQGNGTVAPSGAITVAAGGSQTFVFTPDPGHHVAEVWVDGASVTPADGYTFDAVAADHTLEVVFQPDLFQLQLVAGPGGTVSPSGPMTVAYGETVSVTVTPDPGYQVADVAVDGTSVGVVGGYTFDAVAADHALEATFGITRYTVSALAGGGGSIAPGGDVAVDYGGSVSFAIRPDAGFLVADVVVDGVSVVPVTSYMFGAVNANHAISASFVAGTHTVTATAGPNGSVSPAGPVAVAHGGSHTVSIVPDPGYRISGVVVDGVSVGPVTSYAFSDVTADHSLSASFEVATHPVTVSSTAGGSCSPEGTVQVVHGQDLEIRFQPDPGYRVGDVVVDGASVGVVTAHTLSSVTAAHRVEAVFEPVVPTPPRALRVLSVVYGGGS